MPPTLEPIVTSRQALIVTSNIDSMEPMVTKPDPLDGRAAFSARFNEALDDIDIPPKGSGRQQATANLFSVSQKGARKWLEGESLPEVHKIPAIVARINAARTGRPQLREEWLLFGRGAKYEVDATMKISDANEIRLVAYFRTSDIRGRQTILRVGEQESTYSAAKESDRDGITLDAEESLPMEEHNALSGTQKGIDVDHVEEMQEQQEQRKHNPAA